jgi:hypothetical protein
MRRNVVCCDQQICIIHRFVRAFDGKLLGKRRVVCCKECVNGIQLKKDMYLRLGIQYQTNQSNIPLEPIL